MAGGSSGGLVKRSVTIAGHSTSISLEPIFWDALRRAAGEEGIALNLLVTRLDAQRSGNLSSAIRVWLFERALARAGEPGVAIKDIDTDTGD